MFAQELGYKEKDFGTDRFLLRLMDSERLSFKQELGLLKLDRKRDEIILTELILANLHEVFRVVRKCRALGLSTMDLVQEGSIALLHALVKFDPKKAKKLKVNERKGKRLGGYANQRIYKSVRRAAESYSSLTPLPEYAKEILKTAEYVRSRLVQTLGREPTSEEICANLFPRRTKTGNRTKLSIGENSKQEYIYIGAISQDELFQLIQIHCLLWEEMVDLQKRDSRRIREHSRDDNECTQEEKLISKDESERLTKALVMLKDEEHQIIKMRYGLDGCTYTLKEIGERLGMNLSRVRRIQMRALVKLKRLVKR